MILVWLIFSGPGRYGVDGLIEGPACISPVIVPARVLELDAKRYGAVRASPESAIPQA
ncbi:MAG TPA: hypothetical protein VME17_16805 [Bryobacteraceae bacterium]|nr:hypothetical protein [Bryobacteraceae bacterium]